MSEAKIESPETPATTGANLKWYVVHTYSGCEQSVRRQLEERIHTLGHD